MNCYHCGATLIWESDSSFPKREEYDMVSFLSCSNCKTFVEVYHKEN